MPKKKKTGPGAVAGQSGEHVSAHYYYNPGPNGSASVTRDLSGSTMSDLSLQNKDEIVKSMHDMFSDLDPDVIFIVLSEADFKGRSGHVCGVKVVHPTAPATFQQQTGFWICWLWRRSQDCSDI